MVPGTMPSERVQLQIDIFLDENQDAMAIGDWGLALRKSQDALASGDFDSVGSFDHRASLPSLSDRSRSEAVCNDPFPEKVQAPPA